MEQRPDDRANDDTPPEGAAPPAAEAAADAAGVANGDSLPEPPAAGAEEAPRGAEAAPEAVVNSPAEPSEAVAPSAAAAEEPVESSAVAVEAPAAEAAESAPKPEANGEGGTATSGGAADAAAEGAAKEGADGPAAEKPAEESGERSAAPESGGGGGGETGESKAPPADEPPADEAKADSASAGDAGADKEGAAPKAKPNAGMSGTTLWRPQYRGRIRTFNEHRGFGFIDCKETFQAFSRDVFIHRAQMAECGLAVGQEVVFEVELNKTGHPQARRLQAAPLKQQGMANDVWGCGGMGAGSWGGGWDASYGMGGMGGHMSQAAWGDNRQRVGSGGAARGRAGDAAADQIEELLKKCSGSQEMWEIIERYGHSFGKQHVVAALYRLGLCRKYEGGLNHTSLSSALVDRLVLFPPSELTADEASNTVWALDLLVDFNRQNSAYRFCISLGEQAVRRTEEFSPSQMASLVGALSRVVKTPEDDELVARITTAYSEYAMGQGSLPRFPPEQLRPWTDFLQTAAAPEEMRGGYGQQQYGGGGGSSGSGWGGGKGYGWGGGKGSGGWSGGGGGSGGWGGAGCGGGYGCGSMGGSWGYGSPAPCGCGFGGLGLSGKGTAAPSYGFGKGASMFGGKPGACLGVSAPGAAQLGVGRSPCGKA